MRRSAAGAGALFCLGCADALGPDRCDQVVVSARHDLAGYRALRAGAVAVAGFSVDHALGDQLGGPACVIGVLLRVWERREGLSRWLGGFDDSSAGFCRGRILIYGLTIPQAAR